MRTGVIAKKIGMTSFFDNTGVRSAVTLLQLDNCIILSHKTQDKDGYNATIVGYGDQKDCRTTKPMKGIYAKLGVNPKRKIKEFRVTDFHDIGKSLTVDFFKIGQLIDVSGNTIGKGYAGVMKKYKFGGGDASHGNSKAHRSQGSTGGCQDPGRVFKNKKMSGRMGGVKNTIKNLKILDTDEENQLLVVKGSIPGSKGSFVFLRDALSSIEINTYKNL